MLVDLLCRCWDYAEESLGWRAWSMFEEWQRVHDGTGVKCRKKEVMTIYWPKELVDNLIIRSKEGSWSYTRSGRLEHWACMKVVILQSAAY